MHGKIRKQTEGFTLIETLVAVFLFAVMSAIAFGSLESTLSTRSHLQRENEKWKGLSFFFNRLERDLNNIAFRPVRSNFDLTLVPFIGREVAVQNNDAHISFTRMGDQWETGRPSSMRRVGYRWRENRIELFIWPVLDLAPRTVPDAYTLLDEVKSFEARYLDSSMEWLKNWDRPTPPLAVAVRVALSSNEVVTRIFATR